MKITKKAGEKTEMVGVEKKMEFSIDTSNQMIVSILRDKLYSNKIAAVCREVASNSRDANREAGKGNVPITIKITQGTSILGDNSLNISFRDSGIGISPDRIENVFLKYGSSTKRNTNTQTGGFGIGAKTPFAYSKEFLISTVSDYKGKRMKHVYQAIILSENGLESSQLIAVSEEVTTEETGTEIIVPINEADRQEFEQECIKATVLWDVQPVLSGFIYSKFPKLTNILKGENWRFMSGDYREHLFSASYREVILEIDGIPYKFDIKKISNISPEIYTSLTHSRINKTKKTYFYGEGFENFVLKFKTGELTLSASREEIEYTRENIVLIAGRFIKMEEDVVDTCVKSYEAIEKDLDKLLFYVSTLTDSKSRVRNLYKEMDMAGYLKNNYPETNQFGLNYSSLLRNKGAKFNYFKDNEDKLTPSKKNIITDDIIKEDTVRDSIFVIKHPLERSNTRKNKTLKKMLKDSGKTGFVFVTISYDVFKESSCFKMFTESKIKFVDYKDVELAPLEKRERGERTSTGGGTKVDTSVGTVFIRRTVNVNEFFGDKIKYNKKDNTIVEFGSYRFEGGQKIVLACLKGYNDLKDLDRTRTNINDVLDEETNGLTVQTSEERYKVISKAALIYLLQKFNYKVVFLKKEDLEKLKGEKNAIVGLSKAYKDLLKNESFKEFVKQYNEENSVSDLDLITRKDSSYEEFFKNPLGKAFISLSGIDFSKFKIYSETKDDNGNVKKVSDDIKWSYRDDFRAIAKSLDKKTEKKFEGYLKEEDFRMAREIIMKKYPLIHYMYSEIGDATYNSYKYQSYNNGNKEGIVILKENLQKIIDEALKTK